jgi:HEPN domain-containing protein
MNIPSHDILEKVNKWMTYADEDLRLARLALTLSSGCPYRLIAYHAQQCAEKYLKAFLVFHRVDFPFTHNIGKLLDLCGEQKTWTKKLKKVETLTVFAVTLRYPGKTETVTKQNAAQALRMAEKVRKTVRTALVTDGMEIPKEN